MTSASIFSTFTKRLEGKVALITGGASGIGECAAKLFTRHGAKVAIADIQDELGHSVVNKIGPSSATYVHCNVTNEDHIRNAVDKTVSTYGKLDIMFNNAGILGPHNDRIMDNEKKDFERVLSVNVTGVFLGMKHAARVMVPARSGSIISTSSSASALGGICSHAYTSSKNAVWGLTKNMAVELGQYGIRVNCVSPHGVATPMAKTGLHLDEEKFEEFFSSIANLKGHVLRVDDVAYAALYLASDEAQYVSGQNLFIDGGFGIVNEAMNMFKNTED